MEKVTETGVSMERTEQTQSVGLGFYIKNIILISIFWVVCSIPVITIGASCSAMYRTVHRVLYQKKTETWKYFKEGFKEHFKHSTKCWIVILIPGFILWAISRYLLVLNAGTDSAMGMYGFMFFVMFLYVCVWGMYTFAYSVRFDDSAKVVLGNCLYLVIRHLFSSIIMGIIMGFFVVVTIRFRGIPLIVTPGLATFCIFRIMEKVFSHYMTLDEYKMVLGELTPEEVEERKRQMEAEKEMSAQGENEKLQNDE